VYIATSLDGFIARPDGALDWLPDPAAAGDGEDYGYGQFMSTVDAVILGRNTFDKIQSFGEWLFGGKRVVVLTNRPIESTLASDAEWSTFAGTPEQVVASLSADGCSHAYVDGGRVIQQFLRAGLVQQLIVTRVPVLLGAGIPLFGPLEADLRLIHESTQGYASGLVQSRYVVQG
jgi:dihydrofolate reductase